MKSFGWMALAACLVAGEASAASMLRISCEGDSARAEVSINGQFKGECPVDVEIKAGDIRVRAVKSQNVEVERVFEDSFRLGDGVMKRVEIQLGRPQYTAEGMRRLQARKQAEEEAARRAAEEKERVRLQKIAEAEEAQRQAEARLTQSRAAAISQGVEPGNGRAFKDCPECPELVLLPAGNFRMGSAPDESERDANEGPVHDVQIQHQLAIGRYEITRGEFERFVQATGYRSVAEQGTGCWIWQGERFRSVAGHNWRNPGFPQTDNHPAVCISWTDAQAYVKWLNDMIPGLGFRLPSEAEWEYAARGGRNETRLPWGEDSGRSEQCTYANAYDRSAAEQLPGGGQRPGTANCSDGHIYTASADALKPNAYGLHHMLGNAAEWVEDPWHNDYQGAPVNGEAWTNGGRKDLRPIRGGSWFGRNNLIRPTSRNWQNIDWSGSLTGFRVVRAF